MTQYNVAEPSDMMYALDAFNEHMGASPDKWKLSSNGKPEAIVGHYFVAPTPYGWVLYRVTHPNGQAEAYRGLGQQFTYVKMYNYLVAMNNYFEGYIPYD